MDLAANLQGLTLSACRSPSPAYTPRGQSFSLSLGPACLGRTLLSTHVLSFQPGGRVWRVLLSLSTQDHLWKMLCVSQLSVTEGF